MNKPNIDNEKGKKYILLKLDPRDFEELKSKKEKANFDSWEDFVIKNLLKMSDDDIKNRKINETVRSCFIELYEPNNNKYLFELLRNLVVTMFQGNIVKASILAKILHEELSEQVKNND